MHQRAAARIGELSDDAGDVVVFVGSVQTFHDCHIHVVSSELKGVQARALGTLGDLLEARNDARYCVKVIIIDAALIDAFMELQSRIRQHYPEAVIAVATHRRNANPVLLQKLLEGGVAGSILPMDSRLNVWLSAIRLMLDGGDYIPPELAFSVADIRERRATPLREAGADPRMGGTANSPGTPLTAREYDVIQLVRIGLQNKQIAAELRLSEHTIKVHVHRIIAKLGASNRTEAVALFEAMQSHA